MSNNRTPNTYNTKEAAKRLGVSVSHLYRLVADEKVKPIRFGSYGRIRIPDHEIARLLKNK